MNDAQKNVIQRHIRQLANDIIMSEELFGLLFQHRIFERNMIEMIKAEKTEQEQAYKMLELLPRRGPDAFNNFVCIIQNDYPWLATLLLSGLAAEKTKIERPFSYKSDIDLMRVKDRMNTCDTILTEPEPDIKAKVSTFVHKQFGQSKRISENDKKAVFRWMSQQIQMERKRIASAVSRSNTSLTLSPLPMIDAATNTDEIPEKAIPERMMHKSVQKICEKLHQMRKITIHGEKSTSPENGKNGSNGNGHVMTPATLDIVIGELDRMVNKVDKMESEINKCHVMLGDREKKMSLSLLIYDLSLSLRNKETEVQEERKKCESMLSELYDYSKNLSKLEQAKSQMKGVINNQSEEIEKLKAENIKLKEQVIKLEQMNMQHAEKQKTLENLRNIVRELQPNRETCNESVLSVQTRMSNESKASMHSRRSVRPNQARPFNSRHSNKVKPEPVRASRLSQSDNNPQLKGRLANSDNNIPFSTKRFGGSLSKIFSRKSEKSVFKS
ncbi:hypothetical protein FSP39_016110 [Pinctada imbricata]|uniref:CARD domain-containing protein n=1 Tax=Pinctada imbricata TaxID=66713 RepID=A0AA88XMM5_PINIB|nr:hypothetical protein FSP39_016110 [Pinctada imbricata]